MTANTAYDPRWLSNERMVYRRPPEVISQHACTARVLHTLRPFAVAMAGPGEFDPFTAEQPHREGRKKPSRSLRSSRLGAIWSANARNVVGRRHALTVQ